ncbi:hypothetical protein FHW72_003394 [Ochrobactrum sp. RC6B]|nr:MULTISPECIES: hypothetical protein [Brucella/Ochrobactrum group]MBB3218289.1 hypothetical protein [Ochrobactrum sp. RC6B]MDL2202373.1 hypothetical protein [Brucella intermedia]QNQ40667.1 hypothetical protein IAR37_02190 [Brucella intermedia]
MRSRNVEFSVRGGVGAAITSRHSISLASPIAAIAAGLSESGGRDANRKE